VLEYAFAAQSVEVEGPREGCWVGAHGLREQDDGVAVGDVEAVHHGFRQHVARDVSPV
jgi:hypothetical protein